MLYSIHAVILLVMYMYLGLYKSTVKYLAFMQRQQKLDYVNDNVSVINLDNVPSPQVNKHQPITWVSKLLTYEDRKALLSGAWLMMDHLINEG